MYAVSAGSLDIISTLVGYFLVVNFPIDKRNLVGMTPLLLAAKMGRYVLVSRSLIFGWIKGKYSSSKVSSV